MYIIYYLSILFYGFVDMYRQSAVIAGRRRRTLYVCDTIDGSVLCKLGLSAELVGTGEQSSGQSSSDRVRR